MTLSNISATTEYNWGQLAVLAPHTVQTWCFPRFQPIFCSKLKRICGFQGTWVCKPTTISASTFVPCKFWALVSYILTWFVRSIKANWWQLLGICNIRLHWFDGIMGVNLIREINWKLVVHFCCKSNPSMHLQRCSVPSQSVDHKLSTNYQLPNIKCLLKFYIFPIWYFTNLPMINA